MRAGHRWGASPGYESGMMTMARVGESDMNLHERITVNPAQCGGRPCIRGMRIRVIDVLELFAAGLDAPQILEELPDLEKDDLRACLIFAARQLDHPILVA